MEKWILFLLGLIMFMGALWLMFPFDYDPKNWIAFFPYSKQTLPWQNYVFHMTEKFTYLIFVGIILLLALRPTSFRDYKISLWVYLGVQVVRVIDYFLTYNEVWTWLEVPSLTVQGEIIYFPVDTNTVGFGAFILTILIETIRRLCR